MYKLQHDSIVPADLPKFWGLLKPADMQQYICIRSALMSPYGKNYRNKIENFGDVLQLLKGFCVKMDGDDWKRFLVAGICFFIDGSIAINTHQLRLFIGKCKSSINGSLHKLGYIYSVERSEAIKSITNLIPALKDNTVELRQWTFRSPHPIQSLEINSSSSAQTECESGNQSPLHPAESEPSMISNGNNEQSFPSNDTFTNPFDEIEFDIDLITPYDII